MIGLRDVRPAERPAAASAFVTLAGIMAGHTLTETARDARFLAHVKFTHLAGVYLGIAALAIMLSQVEQRVLHRFGGPLGLAVLLTIGAGVDFLFYVISAATRGYGHWIFYALYFWSSL